MLLSINKSFSQKIATDNNAVFAVIMDNIDNGFPHDIKSVIKTDNSVGKQLALIRDNGSWGDMDYSGKDITVWQPIDHLLRLKDFAIAYTSNNSKYHNDYNLYQSILKGLMFWYQQDPKSKNWWFNEIDVPQKLGEILIIMRHVCLTGR